MGLPLELSSLGMTEISTKTPYPALIKQAAAHIHGVLTEVMNICFSDRIMITISQEGRLAQWVQGQRGYYIQFQG